MQRTEDEGAIQRAAEIIVLGPGGAGSRTFLQAFCPDLRLGREDLLLGSLTIHRELVLYCYGIGYRQSFAWDLVGTRMLGCIAHFDWFDEASYTACRDLVDDTTAAFAAPLVIAADLGQQALPVVEGALKPYTLLSPSARFLFFQSHKPATIRRVVLALLDLLLERVE